MYYIKCRKNRKYYEARLVFQPKGRDSQVETYLRKGNLIFQGYKGSGKSLIYNKFCDIGEKLYNLPIIKIKHSESLADIFYNNKITKDDTEGEFCTAAKEASLIKKAENCLLIVDGADAFSGKKLELLKNLARNCKHYILTALDEKAINQTLQKIFKGKSEPQILQLKTYQTSKDLTNYLFIGFIFFIFLIGYFELALLLTAGRIFMRTK